MRSMNGREKTLVLNKYVGKTRSQLCAVCWWGKFTFMWWWLWQCYFKQFWLFPIYRCDEWNLTSQSWKKLFNWSKQERMRKTWWKTIFHHQTSVGVVLSFEFPLEREGNVKNVKSFNFTSCITASITTAALHNINLFSFWYNELN